MLLLLCVLGVPDHMIDSDTIARFGVAAAGKPCTEAKLRTYCSGMFWFYIFDAIPDAHRPRCELRHVQPRFFYYEMTRCIETVSYTHLTLPTKRIV